MGWITCWKCKERFGLDDATEATLRRSGKAFCCPWGHEAVFKPGPTEAENLRKELEAERRARQRAEQRVAQKADEAEHERRRANGYKGHATRMTKRAKAGVCPCCNRTFKQLASHMANKHPEFTPLEIHEGEPATIQ